MNARVPAFIAVASLYVSGAAAAPPRQDWIGPSQVDTTTKDIYLRKVARRILGWGEAKHDELPIFLGAFRTRLLWRKGWRWHESAVNTRLPIGLQGGPMVSVDLPLTSFGSVLSLESRLCALRYRFESSSSRRLVSEELINPRRKRESIEAGLYLNIALGSAL
ncbi:MAG TPA: hypothetical protein VER33_09695 [Polyangiaceae bacterium]|nr:hypothetical protein [Polyangiaceae bacterium]